MARGIGARRSSELYGGLLGDYLRQAGGLLAERAGEVISGQALEEYIQSLFPGFGAYQIVDGKITFPEARAPQGGYEGLLGEMFGGGITAPVGGRAALGLLGNKLPVSSDTMTEMLGQSGYQIGSAPGVYTHQNINPQRVRATLVGDERALVNSLPKSQQQSAAEAIRDYRATHAPSLGWSPVEAVNVDPAGKIGWRAQVPQFHIDPRTGNPLAGVQRSMVIEDLSTKMVDEVADLVNRAGAGDANAQFIVDQARWYKDAEKTIRDLFGEEAPLYSYIQGSLSPNTRLSQQHKMAQEVFERFIAGEFDDQLARFDMHMARKPEDVSVSKWVNELRNKNSPHYDPEAIIRKKNGKLYGMNSLNAMQAMRGLLQKLEPGQAPKMRNFAGNLAGTSVDPTIDVWAGRTINRLAGNPRIPPAVDAGVPGVMAAQSNGMPQGLMSMREKAARGLLADTRKIADWTPDPDITGQYGVAADVYRTAAAKMGMDPDDLQALMWFREKELWESQGWTPVDQQPSLVDHILRDNPR